MPESRFYQHSRRFPAHICRSHRRDSSGHRSQTLPSEQNRLYNTGPAGLDAVGICNQCSPVGIGNVVFWCLPVSGDSLPGMGNIPPLYGTQRLTALSRCCLYVCDGSHLAVKSRFWPERRTCLACWSIYTVSYTHLTLPTIYSV